MRGARCALRPVPWKIWRGKGRWCVTHHAGIAGAQKTLTVSPAGQRIFVDDVLALPP